MAMISEQALDQLFRSARTHYDWHPEPLPEGTLERLYDLLKMGPTSANCSPARFIFCQSPDAREKLARCASDGNRDKISQAPVTAIIGMDMAFAERLPELFPHTDAASWFAGNAELTRATAFRNSTLQGAWFIMAARAIGLDTGPMSGFDAAAVDREFWSGTEVETNFLCSIGHGTGEKLFERLPRLPFADACQTR